MKIVIARELEYIPSWNGNRKLDAGEQVKVMYRYMTGPEREALFDIDMVLDGEGRPKTDAFKFKWDRTKVIKTCVTGLKSLTVEDGGKERQATVEDVVLLPELSGLYRELSDFLMAENEVTDKKKLK